jgi:signal-transduction protein with cAMP-binding, CBS, and nucleotidyltransferase domain
MDAAVTLRTIFSDPVRRHVAADPLVVGADTPCGAVVERMATRSAESALVVDKDGRLVGIVTERDVTRRVAFKLEREAPVQGAMTSPVHALAEGEILYRAIARARRLGLRRLPVTDAQGRVAGMFDMDVALAGDVALRLDLVDRLAREDGIADLGRAKAAQADLAAALMEERLPATEVQALLSRMNLDIHRRLIAFVLEAMAEDGWGEPPVPFSMIVMGSGGRGESYLSPDQDNGFVLADYPDDEHPWIDRFYTELAGRLTAALAQVGFPLCRGHVMATNPVWRKTLSQWQRQIELWITRGSDRAILNADICFDFRIAAGPAELVEALRMRVLALVAQHQSFLRDMCLALVNQKVALDFFGRFDTEGAGDDRRINLKLRGTIPLVGAVRLLALREGVAATATRDRLSALHERGVLSEAEHASCTAAHGELSELLLRQQIADVRAGRAAGNLVSTVGLSRTHRRRLAESLRAVGWLQQRVREDFTSQIL